MAVSLDVGQPDNVHPADKQTVGSRLALAARNMAYTENVNCSGPLFRQATPELLPDGTPAIRVWFDHVEGLNAHDRPLGEFELAGEDRHFVPAGSRIEGNTVIVSSASLRHPVFVRYGWNSVVTHFLYNAAGLPASTFTSEPEPVR
jgi:sialate O-acetylesterase